MDTVLPFGLRSAPKIFSAIADALEWILLDQGMSLILHYLDDFLTMGRANTTECQHNLELMTRLCEFLGVPLKVEKLEGPTEVLIFLGIILDTLKLEIYLRIEESNQGAEKKRLLHQEGTPQAHWEPSACHKSGYSRMNISVEND